MSGLRIGSWRSETQRWGPSACEGFLPRIALAPSDFSPRKIRYRCNQLLPAWAPWGQFLPRGRWKVIRFKSSVYGPLPALTKVRLWASLFRYRVSWHSFRLSQRLDWLECQVWANPSHPRLILCKVHFGRGTIQIRSQWQQTLNTLYKKVRPTNLPVTRSVHQIILIKRLVLNGCGDWNR